MSVEVTMGFILPCRSCGCEVMVGGTRDFTETNGEIRTAYYDAQTRRLAGISEGTGDSFECLPCYAVKWHEEQR